VQSENKLLEQKVLELQHVAYAAGSGADMPKIAAPVVQQPFSVAGYDGALALFWEKRYDEAISSFTSLLNGGIEADMADHCEYWIGESHYGKKEFREAAVSFEKVIRITISNKKADAYIMLGQAYERLHEDSKARWAYEELLKTYPDNIHAGLAKSRLHLLNQNKAERQDQKHSTT
jgi:TolA-binding protein